MVFCFSDLETSAGLRASIIDDKDDLFTRSRGDDFKLNLLIPWRTVERYFAHKAKNFLCKSL